MALDEQRERQFRLEILNAYVTALERRGEVLLAIADSDDDEAARLRVGEVLGVSDYAAGAVLDLQWRRVTRLGMGRIQAERDDVRRQLQSSSGGV